MTKLIVVSAVLAATAFQQAAAQTQYLGGGRPNSTDINANPNATAVVPVPGWNLAEPYPGLWSDGDDPETAVGKGWTMHLNITANVSTADMGYPSDDPRGPWAMRQTLELRPPQPPAAGAVWDPREGNWTVDKNTTDTWVVSFATFSKVDAPRDGRKNNADGSCDGFFSRECIDGLKQGLASARQVATGNYSIKPWSSPGVVHKECGFQGFGFPSPIDLNENFTLDAIQLWDEPIKAERGEYDSAYDFYGGRPIPYLIIWGHSNTTAVGEPLSEEHVTFGCIKADTAVGDSRLPSSANLVRAGLMTTMWAACAVVAVMLMV